MGSRRERAGRLSLTIGFILWASCSAIVKENRTDCPCSLYISLGALPEEPVNVQVYAGGKDLCFKEDMDRDTTLLVQVPGEKALVVGVSGGTLEDGVLSIKPGSDCPEVFLASELVDTSGDSAWYQMQLHKHFCTLGIYFDGPPGWGEPYSVLVRGKTGGLQPDGTPVLGDFRFSLHPGESCRLPRQAPEEELWLDITMPEGVLRSFALGTYLDHAGYDWTAPDLKDVTLRIDISVTAVSFSIGPWKETILLETEI